MTLRLNYLAFADLESKNLIRPWMTHDAVVSPGWIRPLITIVFFACLHEKSVMVSKGIGIPPKLEPHTSDLNM